MTVHPGADTMSPDETPMPSDDPDPLLSPAEEAFLEAEADRVFGPMKGKVDAQAFQIMRDMFIDVAATHPEAIRLRKLALAEGEVGKTYEKARTETEAKSAPGQAKKGKSKKR
jgi:hypothetical protein